MLSVHLSVQLVPCSVVPAQRAENTAMACYVGLKTEYCASPDNEAGQPWAGRIRASSSIPRGDMPKLLEHGRIFPTYAVVGSCSCILGAPHGCLPPTQSVLMGVKRRVFCSLTPKQRTAPWDSIQSLRAQATLRFPEQSMLRNARTWRWQ
ncbi:hypothetical protein F5883DRAFT_578255 [Diaporthe sp. PMI_573]|nr:hypothetical protein F5883DRAFT_578255 [Diaporthaceae sp. PMI_573]